MPVFKRRLWSKSHWAARVFRRSTPAANIEVEPGPRAPLIGSTKRLISPYRAASAIAGVKRAGLLPAIRHQPPVAKRAPW